MRTEPAADIFWCAQNKTCFCILTCKLYRRDKAHLENQYWHAIHTEETNHI